MADNRVIPGADYFLPTENPQAVSSASWESWRSAAGGAERIVALEAGRLTFKIADRERHTLYPQSATSFLL